MAEIPSDYDFRREFMKRLPMKVAKPLRLTHRVTAETTPLEIILQRVKEVESNNIALSAMEEERRAEPSGLRNRDSSQEKEHVSSREPHTVRFQDILRRERGGNRDVPRRERQDISPRKDTKEMEKEAKPCYQRDDNKGSQDNRLTSMNVTCFKCNKKGHYSRDCPAERLNSQHVPDEEHTDTEDSEGHPGLLTDDDDLEGSQYTSDIDDYEDY